MKIDHCKRCEEPSINLIITNGEMLCPRCATTAMRFTKASANHFKHKIKPVTKIDIDCHLDMICAQVMAFYITNGMSVRQVACQLGITHATVYSKLRKNGLMKSVTQSDCILQPTIGDFRQSGGCRREFVVVQLTEHTETPKKCVTHDSTGESGPGARRSCSPGPASNARKD